jgi:hypothetical protein
MVCLKSHDTCYLKILLTSYILQGCIPAAEVCITKEFWITNCTCVVRSIPFYLDQVVILIVEYIIIGIKRCLFINSIIDVSSNTCVLRIGTGVFYACHCIINVSVPINPYKGSGFNGGQSLISTNLLYALNWSARNTIRNRCRHRLLIKAFSNLHHHLPAFHVAWLNVECYQPQSCNSIARCCYQ